MRLDRGSSLTARSKRSGSVPEMKLPPGMCTRAGAPLTAAGAGAFVGAGASAVVRVVAGSVEQAATNSGAMSLATRWQTLPRSEVVRAEWPVWWASCSPGWTRLRLAFFNPLRTSE